MSKVIFEIEDGILLPLNYNGLFYNKKQIDDNIVLYLSNNQKLNKVRRYFNIDIEKFLSDNNLAFQIFGDELNFIIGTMFSFYLLNINIILLIDSDYIYSKNLSEEYQEIFNNYLMSVKFFDREIPKCENNELNNNLPIDPIFATVIPEDDRIVVGKYCYHESTIRKIVNTYNQPFDPMTRELLSNEIIQRVQIKNIDYVILDGVKYYIQNNSLALFDQINDFSPLLDLLELEEFFTTEIYFDCKFLANMEKLRILSLANCDLENINKISTLTNLKVINLNYVNVSNLKFLSNLINLEELYLSPPEFDENKQNFVNLYDIQDISMCDNLKILTIERSYINNINLLRLKENLIKLEIKNCYDIDNFNFVSELINLKHLSIIGMNILDINFIDNLESLEDLNLTNCKQITTFDNISRLHNLENLTLQNVKISNIDFILELPKLKFLDISGCENITNKDILENLEIFY